MTLRELANRLTQYDEMESRSIVRMLLDDCFGWSYTDICCGALESIGKEDEERLEGLMTRLEDGEPIQYVTGTAMFYNRAFHVENGVLIPRPETEELIDLIKKEKGNVSHDILDIGTGSGCIAVTLAKEIKGANVTAWDISSEALTVAKKNSNDHGAGVRFEEQDIFKAPRDREKYDVIVSNPPYICDNEKGEMEENVLSYEPEIALFVPDEDPLLFYRAITEYASMALREGGLLAFEINPLYAEDMAEMVRGLRIRESAESCFEEIMIHPDQFGKSRFLIARKRSLSGVRSV